MAVRTTTVLIGNPGVGKSALLNSLLGRDAFKSGLSYGTGLSTALQQAKDRDGNIYCDTPGLNDVKIRDKAAKEIEEGLKLGGMYKLIFVITLESGRVKPEDALTMKVVLAAIHQVPRLDFGLIINKLRKQEYNDLTNPNSTALSCVLGCLDFCGKNLPHMPLLIRDNEDMIEQKQPIPGLSDYLKAISAFQIHPASVKSVQVNQFEEQFAQLREELKAAQANEARMREILVELFADQKKNERPTEENTWLAFAAKLAIPLIPVAKAVVKTWFEPNEDTDTDSEESS
eukprot:TRINITY_DN11962_c0_g1::TRINITY_DN11962_c0_g1_i1::g.16955::m.16955 TRINITY_DN11962_c0_g1::TRINITY_DN11962_c0_g1_i1::g.16955  ORF type:complete len:309 (-),score=9.41,AIG1/PF04548.11/5.6e-11,MMR_HSR1/PF01926.18/1.3e-08,MMR_HSR1/PF01926.18/1.5e+03,DUF258/PF03193.11/8e-08,Dynamin_N/PF00350.18/0.0032,Dynamin_N/PF00350.18/50,Dynamin_N/PF00350.18/1.3e+03,AAA_25/PF13481.1/0.24,AAA_25/PF13481.1/22,AAA_16/PF13191.1/0.012,AAA_16/PF13191.1/9.1e+02,FeoB_N/PF02421.13/0.011,Miro/PF08477.8/0.033,ABC_tran/PF0000